MSSVRRGSPPPTTDDTGPAAQKRSGWGSPALSAVGGRGAQPPAGLAPHYRLPMTPDQATQGHSGEGAQPGAQRGGAASRGVFLPPTPGRRGVKDGPGRWPAALQLRGGKCSFPTCSRNSEAPCGVRRLNRAKPLRPGFPFSRCCSSTVRSSLPGPLLQELLLHLSPPRASAPRPTCPPPTPNLALPPGPLSCFSACSGHRPLPSGPKDPPQLSEEMVSHLGSFALCESPAGRRGVGGLQWGRGAGSALLFEGRR